MPSSLTRTTTTAALLFLATMTLPGLPAARAEERLDVSGDSALPPLWEDPAAAPLRHHAELRPTPAPLTAQAMPEDAAWEGFVTPGPLGSSFEIAEWQGKLVLGRVYAAGHVACGGIALWDGTSFESLPPLGGSIYTLKVWSDHLVVATSGPATNYSILMLDGAVWDTLGIANSTVWALGEYQGHLIAGGGFSAVSGTSAPLVAAYDGNAWSAPGTGFSGFLVTGLTEHLGSLVAVGQISPFNGVASLAALGGVWQPVGAGFTGGVYDVVSDGVDLYVAGRLNSSGGVTIGGLARWDGTKWNSTGGPTSLPFSEQRLTRWNGKIVTTFRPPAGPTFARLSQWDGVSLTTVPGDSLGFGLGGTAFHVGTWGTRLVATGSFVSNGSRLIPSVAIYDGVEWSTVGIPWDATMRSPETAAISAVEHWNGKLVVAGAFSLVADQDHYLNSVGLAAWDGNHWAPVSPNSVLAEYRLLGDWSGDLVVTGYNLQIGGTTIRNVARWNGVSWSQVGSTLPFYNDAVQSFHGDLYLSHEDPFLPSDTYIARFDGVSWQSVGSGLNDHAPAMCVHGDSLVVGGYFTQAGGQAANRIAAWDGGAWHPLGDGFNAVVNTVDSWNGRIVAGGPFTASGAQPVVGAAMWDGTSWQQMGANAVNVHYFETEGEELFASGKFMLPGGSVITTVAHWTGSDWHLLGSGTNMYPFAVYDGFLYQAGSGTVHGHVSHGLSRVPLSAVLDAPRPQPRATAVSLAVRPNPVRGPARFSVVLPAATHVRLTVHDVAGRVLATLQDGELGAGEHPIEWAGKASPGIYFVQLATPTTRTARRFVLLEP